MKSRNIFLVFLCCLLLLGLAGCESFTRKFTRKSKKANQQVEMVLVPEEYKGPNMTKEELYRQNFLFWKSWHDELENALTQKSSLKKKVDCAQEALKNLVNMKNMLVASEQKNIDVYINKTVDLMAAIKSDLYGTNDSRNLDDAQRIKMDIHKMFIYPKIKNYLK